MLSEYKVSLGQKLGDIGITLFYFLFMGMAVLLIVTVAWIYLHYWKEFPDNVFEFIFNKYWLPIALFSLYLSAIRLKWRISLYSSFLYIGNALIGHKLKYDKISVLNLDNSFNDGMSAIMGNRMSEKQREKRALPLRLSFGFFGKIKIFFPQQTGKAVFKQLRRHCSEAVGIDLNGNQYLPKAKDHQNTGEKRLRRYRRLTGLAAICFGLLFLYIGIFGKPSDVEDLEGLSKLFKQFYFKIISLPLGLAAVGFGLTRLSSKPSNRKKNRRGK